MCLLQETTTVFDTRQMITDRKVLEETMFAAVRERLGGTCCRQVCSSFAYGFFVDVRYFQLGSISIYTSIDERFMQSLLLQQFLLQEAQIIRKNSTAIVEVIVHAKTEDEAEEIREQARAQAAEKYKSSFDYLRTLRGLNHTHLSVDFQQLITGNF
ncbi:uncharacterized protein LOC132554833 [Ylistrum balloti]|uniref:uncharacterized protein LOC132554833 n=1 Tax=Ylistrum balloti TaxID=509963 RepID=UPI002905905D|nr:uncharacterized protein LOC132554833 [Ylistrum balloti]